MQRLADLLTQRQDCGSLPRPEPDMFTGNPLPYSNWIKSFQTFTERETQNPSKCLYYLGKYTTREAKEAISGLLAVDNTGTYSKARKILFLLCTAFILLLQATDTTTIVHYLQYNTCSTYLQNAILTLLTILRTLLTIQQLKYLLTK